MAVLVRVKRKRDELPSDTLIIAARRMKRERSTKEKLLADFGGMGLEAGARPDTSEPVERRCFRRLRPEDRDLSTQTVDAVEMACGDESQRSGPARGCGQRAARHAGHRRADDRHAQPKLVGEARAQHRCGV